MKLLFIVDDYSGGAGNIIQLLATEYAKNDEVTVLLTNHHSQKRYPCEGVKFCQLGAEEKPSGIRGFLFLIRWVKQRIKKEKPDAVISFITNNSLLVCLGHLWKKLPIIACERVNPLGRKEKFPWNILTRLAYNRAELLTVQFEDFCEMYDGRYKEKCRVVPNYIATPEKTKDLARKGEITRFISCGRLDTSKQFPVLLEMFAQIHKENPKTELRIYGKGPHQERLQKQIRELGLEDCAFFQ